MGKPTKIRKKKSFMFTTKHNSFTGMLGLIIAICSITITITMVMYSYKQAGDVSIKYGTISICLAALNVIGLISGIVGVNERDVYKTPPIISMVLNGIMCGAWIMILLIANR